MRDLPTLPILDALPALREAFASHRSVVLEAPAGAGKSTVVPLALLDAPWRGRGRILMLEPRRIAARAIAERMASLLGERCGGTVGYRTRLESRIGPATAIEVVTEGILTRRLQHDPALEDVALVVFDEFHERSLQADLGLVLCLEAQQHLRESLRLLVMSATLDGDAVARLMGGAPVVRSAGRMHPVDVEWRPATTGPGARIEAAVATATVDALATHPGDALVFLPGAAEIRRVADALTQRLPARDAAVLPLYGELAAAEQDAALAPDPAGRRKVVVATNLAETSLTIDGVRIVVDAGLERRQRFDPATGMGRLETVRISRASAEQRRGRAGRTAPGVCVRLWSESAHDALAVQSPPEILEADLSSLVLELACWGAEPASLRWLDAPPAASCAQARDLLRELEALDSAGRVTPVGREMAELGVHPRLAHLVSRGAALGLAPLACRIAAVLSERDPLRAQAGARDPDLWHRIEALDGRPPPPGMDLDRGTVRRIERVKSQLERRVAARARTAPAGPVPDRTPATGLLLAYAYPDRIGRSRSTGSGRYLLSGGRGATIADPCALARSEYIVVAALDAGDRDARVQLAAALDPALLERHFSAAIRAESRVAWDDQAGAVLARRVRRLGAVTLEDAPIVRPDPSAVTAALLDGIRGLGLGALPWTRDLEQWRARVALAREYDPRGRDGWPDVSDAALASTLEDWLAPWLEGVTRREQFGRIDLRAALGSLLDWNAARRLDELAPTHLTVPSGSRIALDYTGDAPSLAVRLQEVFGLTETPRVVAGRVPVVMELLSPARRPVQVTRDLASFWSRGYHDVKKELKGRYPKHYWPDDPHEATPTRRVRPREGG